MDNSYAQHTLLYLHGTNLDLEFSSKNYEILIKFEEVNVLDNFLSRKKCRTKVMLSGCKDHIT